MDVHCGVLAALQDSTLPRVLGTERVPENPAVDVHIARGLSEPAYFDVLVVMQFAMANERYSDAMCVDQLVW
jgi:hypothetical protein